MHENLRPGFAFAMTNCKIVHFHSLLHHINYKIFMCLSPYWQWKLANECIRISAVIVKYGLGNVFLQRVKLDKTSSFYVHLHITSWSHRRWFLFLIWCYDQIKWISWNALVSVTLRVKLTKCDFFCTVVQSLQLQRLFYQVKGSLHYLGHQGQR